MSDWFRFLHVADTHCGYSGRGSRFGEFESMNISKMTKNDIPVRQRDVADAFRQVIDIAIERNVDAVLHAGDGTDAWGYKRPYVLNQYVSQVSRLYPNGIEYVEIAGNHNLPKIEGAGCYLETLGVLPGVKTVHDNKYEQIELWGGEVIVHCIPSTNTHDAFDEALRSVRRIEGKINIGLGHFGVTEIDFYAKNSETTLVVSLETLKKMNMDYFALGDFHKTTEFTERIRYAGATERFSFNEADNRPKVLLVEINKHTKEIKVEEIFLKTRPMIVFEDIDAKGKSIEDINKEIIETMTERKDELENALVRVRVINLPNHLKSSIETEKIKELTKHSLYTKIELKKETEMYRSAFGEPYTHIEFKNIVSGWEDFMNRTAESLKQDEGEEISTYLKKVAPEKEEKEERNERFMKELEEFNDFAKIYGKELLKDVLEEKDQEKI